MNLEQLTLLDTILPEQRLIEHCSDLSVLSLMKPKLNRK